MAQIVIEIPEDKVQLVIDAVCYGANYDQIPEPKIGKAAFVKKTVIDFLKDRVFAYERDKAVRAAREASVVDIT